MTTVRDLNQLVAISQFVRNLGIGDYKAALDARGHVLSGYPEVTLNEVDISTGKKWILTVPVDDKQMKPGDGYSHLTVEFSLRELNHRKYLVFHPPFQRGTAFGGTNDCRPWEPWEHWEQYSLGKISCHDVNFEERNKIKEILSCTGPDILSVVSLREFFMLMDEKPPHL